MGIKEFWDRQLEVAQGSAFFGKYRVQNGKFSGGISFLPQPIAGAHAEFDSGTTKSRMTATRVAAGAILAGPAGAIVGGMLKKDKSKVYATIIFSTGNSIIIEAPKKEETKLRKFVTDVNRISAAASATPAGAPQPGIPSDPPQTHTEAVE